MPISRYPRCGYPLAPTALKPILSVRIPKKLLEGTNSKATHYCDLDKQVWETLAPDLCNKLGQELVEIVRAEIATLPESLMESTLPRVPPGMRLEELELERRTYNCLCQMQFDGLLTEPQELSQKTIKQVLALESFGAKSLVDLLTSLEGLSSGKSLPKSLDETEVEQNESCAVPVFIGRFRNLRLPNLPIGTKLTDLQLSRRTYNRLIKRGFGKRLAEFTNLTLAEALEIPGFGMQCLLDFLDAVDRFCRGETEKPREPKAPFGPYADFKLHQYLEDELRDLVSRSVSNSEPTLASRNIDIVMMLYGCGGGGGGVTLQEVGETFGITKERIRQICEKVAERLKLLRSLPPRLKAVLEMIAQQLPSDV